MKQSIICLRALTIIAACIFTGSLATAQVATDAGPASAHTQLTPSNTTSLLDNNGQPYCRALFVEGDTDGGTVDVSITDVLDVTIVYTVNAGTLLPFRPKRVNSTGTSAGASVICWRS